MPDKKPPYSHRAMAKLLFKNPPSSKYQIIFIPTWLKVEAYTLFFTALPHLIAAVIWVVIIAAILWAVTLI